MLDSGDFKSLDQVGFIMTLEEMFDVIIDDEKALKILPSHYETPARTIS
jgi:acyl carrier protein